MRLAYPTDIDTATVAELSTHMVPLPAGRTSFWVAPGLPVAVIVGYEELHHAALITLLGERLEEG